MKFTFAAVSALLGATQAVWYPDGRQPTTDGFGSITNAFIPRLENLDLVIDAAAGKRAHELTNGFRKEEGLAPVEWDDEIYQITIPHTRYMANLGTINHDNFNERMRQLSYSWRTGAENVAYNYNKDDPGFKVVDQWKNSSGHRKNMLKDNVNREAVSAIRDTSNGRIYFTQMLVGKR